MRYLAIPCVLLTLLLHSIVGFGVWRAAREPERSDGFVEPRSGALTARAELGLQTAIAALSDRSQSPADRLEAYRTRLRDSRQLLIRSLDVNPAQPDALASLAAIDYELAPSDRATLDQTRERIETAALLAPRVPRVQAKLGELLLRMGYTEEALGYLARGADLDAALSERVVRLAIAHDLRAETIRDALPHNAAALTALRHAFPTDPLGPYVEWVETAIDAASVEPTHDLLWAYADAALEIEQPRRLADRLDAWGPFADPGVEASRHIQRARAALALDQPAVALEWAQSGHALAPESQRIARVLGDTARAASRPDLALNAYRHGLGTLARRNARPVERAFFYRRIGEAQEELKRADLAYDAYVKALELNPAEPHARRRVTALAKATPTWP